jgi:hypothetical protein
MTTSQLAATSRYPIPCVPALAVVSAENGSPLSTGSSRPNECCKLAMKKAAARARMSDFCPRFGTIASPVAASGSRWSLRLCAPAGDNTDCGDRLPSRATQAAAGLAGGPIRPMGHASASLSLWGASPGRNLVSSVPRGPLPTIPGSSPGRAREAALLGNRSKCQRQHARSCPGLARRTARDTSGSPSAYR